jgi:EPS-associated MarR family transcriptional regulator
MNDKFVQIMNTNNKDSNNNQDYLNILRKINKKSNITQRNMANELGISLGKLNYCLIELKKKGWVKIKNFRKNPNKMMYAYILTPKGISTKTKLTINFMKRKMEKYDELKKEISEKN